MYNTTPSSERERSYNGGYMQAGKSGEATVLDWLNRSEKIISVNDVSENPEYQSKEIDFVINWRTGQQSTIEVKTDTRIAETGNFVFELLRINHTSSKKPVSAGWSIRSQADFLAYLDERAMLVYWVKMDDFRRGFAKIKRPKIITVPTDKIKSTVISLVPVATVAHKVYSVA